MSHKAIKIGLTAAVLIAAFSALLFTTLQDNLQYYKYVDEVAAAPHEWKGRPSRFTATSSLDLLGWRAPLITVSTFSATGK